MWFSPNQMLTKQRLFNFVIGYKGNGKTTGCRNYCLDQWLKNPNNEFGVIRRYKEETKRVKNTFFADCQNKFGYDIAFKLKGNVMFGNEKPLCTFFTLSTDARMQGINCPNIKTLIFDEFLLDPHTIRYLPNEPEQFARLYDTIARPSDKARKKVQVIFLANAFSAANPYFNYFHISFNPKGEFLNKSIYALKCVDPEYEEQAESTDFGILMANTEYSSHAYKNEFLLDNSNFIDKNKKKGTLIYIFIWQGKTYGCWVNWQEGYLFISSKYDPSCKNCYCFTTKEMQPNCFMASSFKGCFHGKITKQCYNTGNIFFESLAIKNMFFDIARICNF